MKTGLVFGKFLPLHNGHIALVSFALQHCEELVLVLCISKEEPIPGDKRRSWLDTAFGENKKIRIVTLEYDETELPNTSVSSKAVSALWAKKFAGLFPGVSVVFTSEPYGEYVAEYMGIAHLVFDEARKTVPVSASLIRESPFQYWEFMPLHVRSYFTKKICLAGTESTGKTTLAEKLATHYHASFVTEAAREIIAETENCTYDDLRKIAFHHAKAIIKGMAAGTRLLFADTDLTITRSYSQFLFNRPLETEQWVQDANHFDLYLFLEPDCEYVQDGTRLSLEQRNRLSDHHKSFFLDNNLLINTVSGGWEERFLTSCAIIDQKFGILY